MTSPNPVIKASVATEVGLIDEIPPSLRGIRKASGFNYGKLDYTEVNGEIIAYDINKTPTIYKSIFSLLPSRKLADFANEIHNFDRAG